MIGNKQLDAFATNGFREILGICEGAKEDKSGRSAFPATPGLPWPQSRLALPDDFNGCGG